MIITNYILLSFNSLKLDNKTPTYHYDLKKLQENHHRKP